MVLPLESFDAPTPQQAMPVGPSPDYLEGHAAGVSEAEARLAARSEQLSSEILAALQDLGFGYAEARRHILDSLKPLLHQIASSILPMALRDGFAQELARITIELCEEHANRPVAIVVGPENLALLRPLISEVRGIPVTLVEDPALGPDEAYWTTPAGELSLDLGVVIDGIRDAIDSLTVPENRRAAHG